MAALPEIFGESVDINNGTHCDILLQKQDVNTSGSDEKASNESNPSS